MDHLQDLMPQVFILMDNLILIILINMIFNIGFTSTSAYAGLGTNSIPKKNSDDDVYQNYRRLRSDVYHNTIPRGLSSISKDA